MASNFTTRDRFLAILSVMFIGFTGCSTDPELTVAEEVNVNSAKLKTRSARLAEVPIGAVGTFAVFGATGVTNEGASTITGDVGVSPATTIDGFEPAPANTITGPGTVSEGPGLVTGTIHAGGDLAAEARSAVITTYDYLFSPVPDVSFEEESMDGAVFAPGIYGFQNSAILSSGATLYLDFQDNPDALFIFQIGGSLTTAATSNIIAINTGGSTCVGENVYWAVGSTATIEGTQFVGTVVANSNIIMANRLTFSGSFWTVKGSVSLNDNTIKLCTEGGIISPDPDPEPDPVEICNDFVAGGGWINYKSTFAIAVGIKDSKLKGSFVYHDFNHRRNSWNYGYNVISTKITAYKVIDAETRQIEGFAKINGKGSYAYKLVVTDKGKRGDTFSIELSNGYESSGTLKGGNIKIHTKCREVEDEEDEDNFSQSTSGRAVNF